MTIKIPHNTSDCPGLPIFVVYWYNPQTGTWSQEGITNVQHQVVFSTVHTVSFQTTHFTVFGVGAYDSPAVSSGGGGGGGCALSAYPNRLDSIGGFFLPYIVYIVVLILISHADSCKRKIKNDH